MRAALSLEDYGHGHGRDELGEGDNLKPTVMEVIDRYSGVLGNLLCSLFPLPEEKIFPMYKE